MTIVAAPSYYEAIKHLPPSAALSLENVAWDEYVQLLDEMGESYAERIFYDSGRMEVMAPGMNHEQPKEVLNTLVKVLRDELDIDILGTGATTLKAMLQAKGAEPDDSFYIQYAARMLGKEDLDLQKDPPPDLVVKVDRTSGSLNKFEIYAAFGVPEIWRIVNSEVRIYWLAADQYETSQMSRAFPFLSAAQLSEFLQLGLEQGERAAARALRVWFAALPHA